MDSRTDRHLSFSLALLFPTMTAARPCYAWRWAFHIPGILPLYKGFFKVNLCLATGLQLLSEELGGQLQFENHQGTRVSITFREHKIVSPG